jgi:hypothetical protein
MEKQRRHNMDAHAWENQNRLEQNEANYKIGLQRAATGAGQLAQMVGGEKAKEAFSSGLERLARGGPAAARRPYLVGEKGPELMVPDQDGTIIPNHKLQVIARALKKRANAVPRAKGGAVKADGEPDPGGLDTANKDWPGPVKAAAEREAGLAAGAPSLGSPESYGGGRRTTAPQLQEAQLSTGPQRFIPIDREADQPGSSWKSGGQLQGAVAAPRPGRDLSEKDPNTGFDPSKPSFSNPIHVIRRMASTWQGPTPGQEYRTLEQANQAFIRAGQGEALPGTRAGYDPVEGPKIRALGEEQRATDLAANKRPDLVALAKTTEADLATKTSEGHVASLKNWLDTTFGTYDSSTGKTAFKPADEGVSRDALAAAEVARREGAPAAKTHFQERQAVRSYLKKVALPANFDVNAYMGAVGQNPAAWQELVAKGRAQKVTAPATSAEPGAMEQLGMIGKQITPGWMEPRKGVNY